MKNIIIEHNSVDEQSTTTLGDEISNKTASLPHNK